MHWRCVDWLRSKGEGNGDARRGFANRIQLVDEFDDDFGEELEIERFISSTRVAEWRGAADLVGVEFEAFVVITLDRATAAIKQAAVAASVA